MTPNRTMKDVKAVGSLLIWEEDSWPHDICTAGGWGGDGRAAGFGRGAADVGCADGTGLEADLHLHQKNRAS